MTWPPSSTPAIGNTRGAVAPGHPKRFSLGVREMFALQPRLEHARGRRALRMLEHPRFRAGYDLLLLRAEYGLAPRDMAQWWTRLQEVSVEERGPDGRCPRGRERRARGRAPPGPPAAPPARASTPA